jgi:hypothetical protein
MNFRITAVLFAVVIVLVAALLVSALFQDDPAKTAGGLLDPLTSAGVKADDVDAVEITRKSPDDQRLVFQKKDGKWVLTAPVSARVDPTAVADLIRDLFAAKPVNYPGLTDNPATYGLGNPTYAVTLKKGDAAATVRVGTTLIGKDKAVTFVAAGDRPTTPIAIRTADLRSLFKDSSRDNGGDPHVIGKWLTEYRQKRLLSASDARAGDDLSAVTITRGDKTLSLKRDGDDWAFSSPKDFGQADTAGDSAPSPDRFTGVRPLLGAVLGLQTNAAEDFIEDVPAADYPKYGLAANDPAVVRLELTPKAGGPPEVLYLGKKVEKDGKPVVPTRVYARLEGDSAVATVTTDRLDALVNTVADPTPMRNRDLIAEAKRDRIDAIDSSFGGGFKARRVTGSVGPQWVLYGKPTDPTEAVDQNVAALVAALAKPRVAAETLLAPNDAAFADAQRKGELKVWFEGVEKAPAPTDGKLPAEPKLKGDPTTFTFGQTDGQTVFVRRTAAGKTTDFKVPLDVFTAASKSRLGLVDPKLGSFSPALADSLVVFRNGERTELKRDAGIDPAYLGGKWSFVSPDALKGKVADGDAALDVLSAVAALPSTRVASEGATDDELKKLGLDPASPTVAVTVGLSGEKDKQRVYHFGAETEDKKAVHFRLVGKPFVLLADRTVLAQLQSADLADKVVFRVDPKAVKKLYLSGWRATAKDGKPVDATLALENGVWVAKEPAGGVPDTSRVTAILTALQAPKVMETLKVEEGKAAPPEFGFGGNPVSIVAELEDKTAVSLLLGGENPAKTGVYAQTGGKTVLLPAGTFRPILDKPPLAAK